MTLKVTGGVSFTNTTIGNQGTFRGNVTILLDGNPYGTSSIGDDGRFLLSIPIPLSARFGTHSVGLVYIPTDPRMDTSTRTDQAFICNSEFVAIAVVASILAPELLIIRRRHRRERRVKSKAIAEVSEEPLAVLRELKPPMTMTQWQSALKAAEVEHDAARKVVMCYRLAQNLVASRFNQSVDDAETHLEFYRRVVSGNPPLAPDLIRLVELFELAEYSQFRIPASDGDEAEDRLLRIRDADWI